MNDKVILEEMSWIEVEEAVQAGRDSVIICVGVVEEHGPHLPLNTDTVLGQFICEKVARQLGNVLVGPPLNFGVTWYLRDYPGTIHLHDETMILLLTDYYKSLVRAGFTNIIFLNQHGSNEPALQAVVPRFNYEGRARTLLLIPWTYLPEDLGRPLFNRQLGYHANDAETAMMLYVRPDLVQMEKTKDLVEIPKAPAIRDHSYRFLQWLKGPYREPGHGGARLISKTGAFGRPADATREFGEQIVEGIIANIVKDLRVILAQ